jgi:hypothetical protein
VSAFGGAVWAIGELITGLTRTVERDAILVRLGISLFGSFASVITATLHQFGIQTVQSGGIGELLPLASGLGSVALGAHALLHQIHLVRESTRY